MHMDANSGENDKIVSHPPVRIVSLDALRGGAIMGMILVHSLWHVYDYQWVASNPSIISTFPILVLILAALFSYFGMWISFFIFLSSIVNTYVMTKKVMTNKNITKALFKQVLSGSLILIASYIHESIIGYYGTLGNLIRHSSMPSANTFISPLYLMRPLNAIGWSIIIIALIHASLMYNNGYKKYTRNLIIYILLFLAVIITTPFAYDWGKAVLNNPKFSIQFLLASWLTGANGGDLDPLLPYLGTAFVGAIIGMSLSKDKPPKHLSMISSLAALLIAIAGVLMIVFHIANHVPATIFRKPPELPMYFLFLSGQIALTMLFLSTVEYKNKMKKFANNFIIKRFRMWSMVSLSMFVFDLYELIPRGLLNIIIKLFTDINLLNDHVFQGITGFYWSMLTSIFVLVFYDVSIKLWSKINFVGSFEWMIVKIEDTLTQVKSQKLNVNLMFNKAIFVGFTDKSE